MHIIFGEAAKQLADKFTVLELDTFVVKGTTDQFISYCVVENIPLSDFPVVDAYIKVHHDMMQAYKQQHWDYCESAIKGLMGKWNGELDSFYQHLFDRVAKFKENPPGSDWTAVLEKS